MWWKNELIWLRSGSDLKWDMPFMQVITLGWRELIHDSGSPTTVGILVAPGKGRWGREAGILLGRWFKMTTRQHKGERARKKTHTTKTTTHKVEMAGLPACLPGPGLDLLDLPQKRCATLSRFGKQTKALGHDEESAAKSCQTRNVQACFGS